MSQFGGQRPQWGKPSGQQINPQLFTGQLGGAAAAMGLAQQLQAAMTPQQAAALQHFASSQQHKQQSQQPPQQQTQQQSQMGLHQQPALAHSLQGMGGLAGLQAVNAAAFQQQQQSTAVSSSGIGMQQSLSAVAVARAQHQQHQQQPPPSAQAVAAAHLQQQQAAAAAQAAQGGGQTPKNQRAFVGVVTKMQDNYGFVDDDVFFQVNVVRGQMPRVGDRVMVEANYNPSMPFKWNAFRIQLLPNQDQPASQQQQAPPPSMQHQQHHTPVGGGGGGIGGGRPRGESDRWGPPTGGPPNKIMPPPAERQDYRHTPQHARAPMAPIHRDRSPPHAALPVRRRERTPPPRRSSPPPRRASPPPRRRSADREPRRHGSVTSATSHKRERERTPPQAVASARKEKTSASRSPPRRRTRVVQRYMPNLPKISFDVWSLGQADLRHRYSKLYVPSDFFSAELTWRRTMSLASLGTGHHRASTLPVFDYEAGQDAGGLRPPAAFAVMHKDVDPVGEATKEPEGAAVIDPPDADYRYSAKVMLLSCPAMADYYRKVVGVQADATLADDADTTAPSRVINFLVGQRGKNESMAIGGAWSPSLDGADPVGDPSVLIRTAVRTTRALTGVDLSRCTQWYKFLEVRYRRIEKEERDRAVAKEDGGEDDAKSTASKDDDDDEGDNSRTAARVDTVAVFLPDVWAVAPTRPEFERLSALLKQQLKDKLTVFDADAEAAAAAEEKGAAAPAADATAVVTAWPTTDLLQKQPQETKAADAKDTKKDESKKEEAKKEATEEKDYASMKVVDLRTELKTRNLDTTGVKAVLVQRLTDALKTPDAKGGTTPDAKGGTDAKGAATPDAKAGGDSKTAVGEQKSPGPAVAGQCVWPPTDSPTKPGAGGDKAATITPAKTETDNKKTEEKTDKTDKKSDTADAAKTDEEKAKAEEKKKEQEERKKEQEEKELKRKKEREEKERKEKRAALERHYSLPSSPAVLVFPHRTAKQGKFDCKLVTLHSLLDYRPDDNKEHSFEVAVFAEAFSELMTRDYAFTVYRTLMLAADRETERKIKDEQEKAEKEAAEAKKKQEEEQQKMDEAAKPAEGDEQKEEAKEEKDKAAEITPAVDEKKKDDKEEKKDEKKKEDKSKDSKKSKEEKEEKTVVKVNEPAVLAAFAHFDPSQCGYIYDKDAEEIVHLTGLKLSRAQVHRLVKKHLSRDSLPYRRFTDVIVSKTTNEVRWSPARMPLAITDEELVKGNTELCFAPGPAEGAASAAGGSDITDNPCVTYRGALVDVRQMLEQVQRLDREQKEMETRNTTLEREMKSVKATNNGLLKRKQRLDEDIEKYKKRIHDNESCLKNSQDDTVQLKTAMQECRKLGEKIAQTVDKVMPPMNEEKDDQSGTAAKKEAALPNGDTTSPTDGDSIKDDEDSNLVAPDKEDEPMET